MTYLEELEAELQPVKQMLEKRLEEVKTEIEALRSARTRIKNLLAQLDPQKKREHKPQAGISEESYAGFRTWLQENRDQINANGGFYAGGLWADPEWTVISDKSRIARAIVRAHDEGILTLSSKGRGGRKNYKVL